MASQLQIPKDDIDHLIHLATHNLSITGAPLIDTRTQLFVGNLPYRVRWQDLKDLFRSPPTSPSDRSTNSVLRADVSLGPDNRSRGYGTVLLATREDAERAMKRLDGYVWMGRTLEVREDRLGVGVGSPRVNAGGSGVRENLPPPPPAQVMNHLHGAFGGFGAAPRSPMGLSNPNPPTKSFLLTNIPPMLSWQTLKDFLRGHPFYITVIKAEVPPNMGYAIVSVPWSDGGKVWRMDGYDMGGCKLSVRALHDSGLSSEVPSPMPQPLTQSFSQNPEDQPLNRGIDELLARSLSNAGIHHPPNHRSSSPTLLSLALNQSRKSGSLGARMPNKPEPLDLPAPAPPIPQAGAYFSPLGLPPLTPSMPSFQFATGPPTSGSAFMSPPVQMGGMVPIGMSAGTPVYHQTTGAGRGYFDVPVVGARAEYFPPAQVSVQETQPPAVESPPSPPVSQSSTHTYSFGREGETSSLGTSVDGEFEDLPGGEGEEVREGKFVRTRSDPSSIIAQQQHPRARSSDPDSSSSGGGTEKDLDTSPSDPPPPATTTKKANRPKFDASEFASIVSSTGVGVGGAITKTGMGMGTPTSLRRASWTGATPGSEKPAFI